MVGHNLHISKEKDMMVLVVARRFMDKFMEEGALYDWISTIMLPFLGYMLKNAHSLTNWIFVILKSFVDMAIVKNQY